VPRLYPPEFRARAIALVRSGKQVKQTAYELGISAGCLHNWVKQDRVDRGELPGKTTAKSAELRAARNRTRELETDLAIVRQAGKFLGPEGPHPKGSTR
jgi:transposase